MKPVDFEGRNALIAEHQDEYITLPAQYKNDDSGTVIFCWELSWRERFKALFTGVIWQAVLTFGGPLQPQMLATEKLEDES